MRTGWIAVYLWEHRPVLRYIDETTVLNTDGEKIGFHNNETYLKKLQKARLYYEYMDDCEPVVPRYTSNDNWTTDDPSGDLYCNGSIRPRNIVWGVSIGSGEIGSFPKTQPKKQPQQAKCTCDFSGPNCWLGCRCGGD